MKNQVVINQKRPSRFSLFKSILMVCSIILVFGLSGCGLISKLFSKENITYFPVRSDEGTGIMNCKGEWLIEPIGQDVGMITGPMSDGWAPLFNIEDNYYNFINSKGELLNNKKYDKVMPFSEGLAAVSVNDKWGFVNTKGEYAIRPKYVGFAIGYFNEGLANVGVEVNSFGFPTSWVFIDPEGKEILGPYYNAGPFSNGYAEVAIVSEGEDSRFGFIDRSGLFVLEFSKEDRLGGAGNYSEGLFPVVDIEQQLQEGTCSRGFVDKKGDWVIDPQYCSVGAFHDGLALATTSKESPQIWGYINTSGEMVIDEQYDLADNFSGGCARVFWDGYNSMGLINTKGELIYQYGD